MATAKKDPAAAVQGQPAGAAAAMAPGLALLAPGAVLAALVALIAVGGISEYSSSLTAAIALLFVAGPVACGGLSLSLRRVAAFFSLVAETRPEGLSDKAKGEHGGGQHSQNGKDNSVTPPSAPGAAKLRRGAPAAPVAGGDAPQDDGAAADSTAAELVFDAWSSVPSLADALESMRSAWREFPAATGRLPGHMSDLWQWLNRDRYKPFPWHHLPDPVAFVWGVSLVVFMAPILALEILTMVPLMELLKAEWRQPRFKWGREALPEFVRSFSRPLGKLMLRDPRNHSYLPWMFLGGVVVPTVFFWALWRYLAHGFEFSTLCAYHLLRTGPRFQLFAHMHTLAHKEGHSRTGLFRAPFTALNVLCEWWIGPFWGIVPWSYYMAHMKIHHRWHNDIDDVHTNLDLDRTNPLSFLIYMPRFVLYWSGVSPLVLFVKRQEWLLMRKLLTGMGAYYMLILVLFCWKPWFCVLFWVFPHVEGMVLLGAISYLWHAFVEESDPSNQYVNSVTILDGRDNVWNEDYHVVHHHAPNVHWTDAPAHFEEKKAEYAKVTATIFRDTEEGQLLQWMFEQNWDMMAKHFVDLDGKLTHEEKKNLIVRRLKQVCAGGRDAKNKKWGSSTSIREYND